MYHTLSLDELKEFLKVLCLGLKSFDDEFKYLQEFYDDAISWDRTLCSLNHLVSRAFEQFDKEGINYEEVIEYIYSLNEKCNFEIQEGEIRFLNCLFDMKSMSALSLEEELVITQNSIRR